jgi:tetratricopeptide (TPR) repeat protein
MPGTWAVLLALSAATVTTDSVVRSGCESDDRELARLPAGASVEVRSALSGGAGTCFKIVATVDGKTVSGYVPAKLLQGAESFDQARRSAQSLGGGVSATMSEVKSMVAKAAAPRGAKEHPASKALELVQLNQPAEALRLLDSELKRYPRDPYLLAVAGFAYYKTDDLDRAIIAFKDSLDIEHNPGVEQFMKRAMRERDADRGSERMTGIRVTLRYERGSVPADLARAMLDVLDQEYMRVSSQIGCRANEKLMAVVQSRESYLQSTSAAEWSGGMYDGRIHIPVTETRSISPQTRRVFAHELVHACLSELGQWPAWVQEGLAQKYSGEAPAAEQQAIVREMLRAKQLPRVSQLGASFSRMSSEHARVAYTYAYLAAEKLLELNASVGIGNLLRNPGDLSRYTEQVEKALGF